LELCTAPSLTCSSAEAAARKIFDGDNKFPGVDVLAKTLFDEKTYKEYLKRKAEYNKYSS
jgi:hypothetical protein